MQNFCTECGKPVQADMSFCTNCGARLTHDNKTDGKIKFEEKRARVLGQKKSAGKLKLVIFAFIAAAIGYILFVYYATVPPLVNPIIKKQPVVTAAIAYTDAIKQMTDVDAIVSGEKIILPLDVVKQQKFVAFNYASAGKIVPLLAYISGEGKLITAVSMCEPCESTRFHIRAITMVCNSCGTTWELNNLDGVSGACLQYPPDVIPSTIIGNEIQINKNIVENWVPRI